MKMTWLQWTIIVLIAGLSIFYIWATDWGVRADSAELIVGFGSLIAMLLLMLYATRATQAPEQLLGKQTLHPSVAFLKNNQRDLLFKAASLLALAFLFLFNTPTVSLVIMVAFAGYVVVKKD